jgi:hypothetical protein
LLRELCEEVLAFFGGLNEMIDVRRVGDRGELCSDRNFKLRSREKIGWSGFGGGFATTTCFEVIAVEATTEGVPAAPE